MAENKDTNSLIRLISIFILVGLIISVCVSVITSETDKNSAATLMRDISTYIKNQCIRYEELAAEDTARDLCDLTDNAFEMRKNIDFSSENIMQTLGEIANDKRFTGILVSDAENPSSSIYYGSDDVTKEYWLDALERYDNISGHPNKSYCGRYTGTDGYYYYYVLVSRTDKSGIILCYKRRRIDDVEDARFSTATLLHGYNFEKNGVVVVTDGTVITASNKRWYEGMAASDCPVVRSLRKSAIADNLIKVEDDGLYYGIRAKSKDNFIYVYLPDAEVFTNRSLIMSYTLASYMFFVIVVLILRQRLIFTKQREQEQKDEVYRKEKDRLAKDAIRANEVKTDFLRRMSHDIRTPINGIRGLVQIGEYYYDDAEKQKECREKIWNTSGYLLDLVNDVLDMSKAQTGALEWQEEQFVLSDLISEIVTLNDFQAKEHGIKLIAKPWCITHDYLSGGKVQLKRILTNLIGNAIKYNKPNGEVVVSCEELGSDGNMAQFRFVCADTGIGMDEKFVETMYEPFTQENTSVQSSLGGVGLGLSIVKKLVDSAHGTISVTTEKGVGTTFTVDLAFAIVEKPKAASENTSEVKGERLSGNVVLVAEDNDLNYEIAEFILEVEGATVIRAVDGKQAEDIFRNSKEGEISAILMDVMMPGTDGLAATRNIRALDRSDAAVVPIIAMTANAFADDVEEAREAGMDAHIAKPIDSEKLIACVVRLINKRYHGGG